MKREMNFPKELRSLPRVLRLLATITLLNLSSLVHAEQKTNNDHWTVERLTSEVLSKNPEVQIAQERFDVASKRVEGAKGRYYPKLSAASTYSKQDNSGSQIDSNMNSSIEMPSSDGVTTRATLQQNLYNGFQDHDRVRQREIELKKTQLDVRTSTLSQKESAIAAIYKILIVQTDIDNLQAKLQVEKDREQEVERKVRSRLSKSTDLLSLQATRASTESDLASSQLDLETRWQELSMIAGHELRQSRVIQPNGVLTSWPQQLEASDFPEVRAAELDYESAQKSLSATKGQLQPTVDLSYNYYLSRPESNRANKWDLQLTLSIPFPWDKEKAAQVGEQESLVAEKQIVKSKNALSRQLNLKTLVQSYETDLKRLGTLDDNVKKYERLSFAMKKENLNGLVSIGEYLQSLTNLLQARQSRDHLRLQLYEKLNRLNEYKIELSKENI